MARSFLMIHGIGCGGDAWDRMRPGFERADWACEAPTLFPEKRTLSDPPADLPNLRFEDYVDAMGTLARQMAETHGEKPVVIGHSMGGLIGQKLVERGDVAAGIFLAPAQPEGCLIIAPSMIWTFANVFRRGTRKGRDLPHKVWKTGFRWGVLNRVPPERHDAIYRTARFDSGHVYGDISDGIVIDESKIRVPTLTIGALQDRATVIKAIRKVAKKYANAEVPGDYLEYSDHAHWILDEPGTDRVLADILAWLDLNLPKAD